MTLCLRKSLSLTALAIALAGSASAAQGPMDFLFGSGMPPASERVVNGVQRIWKLGEYSALRLSAAGTNYQHPAAVDAAILTQALASVQYESPNGSLRPLFVLADLPDVCGALSKALAVAAPQDEVLLMVSARYDGALLGLQRSVLARLFVREGALHIVVKDARADVLSAYRLSNTAPALDFGSANGASSTRISAPGAQVLRSDWLALDVAAVRKPAAVPAALPAPAPALAPATNVIAAPAATSPARDKSFYDRQAERLEGLKSLRDKGLITDAEYQQKRAEVLQAL